MNKIRLAIIGCGAVVENVHLPVIGTLDDIELVFLVDKNMNRAKALASQFEGAQCAQDVSEIIGSVDAAIVAVPHHLHEPISSELLNNSIHVLVEKPMAMNVEECLKMNTAANKGQAVLTVGLARRFYPASIYIKKILDSGMLGDIQDFDFQEGSVYSWPVMSDFIYRKEAGGGVLADTGSHVLDLLIWWLGDFSKVEYYDDALGGVEADCELRLSMKSGASGTVKLSRLRELTNSYIIEGEFGSLEVEANYNPEIRLKLHDQNFVFNGRVESMDAEEIDPNDIFLRQFLDFVHAIQKKSHPLVSGEEGMKVVRLIEACYSDPRQMNLPWIKPAIPV